MPMYNPPIAHYCHVNVSNIDEQSILKVIGRNGHHFKRITETSGASYIWWNRYLGIIEIWGPHHAMTTAKRQIETHIMGITA